MMAIAMTPDENPSLPPLPIETVLPDLKAALYRHRAAVLVAPPGAGKTTVVPLVFLDAAWLVGRRILLLAPRRLAARAAARRLAAVLGQSIGQTVGYQVRLERRVGPDSRIVVVTEGILTRMLQADPALTGVGLVIFDEFHERSLDADLGLALCRDMQGVLNADLRLLVMSATLDPAPVAALLGQAPLIRCDGRAFGVETRYVAPSPGRPVERDVVDVIQRSVAAGEGSLLVFLPGAGEIRRVARLLTDMGLPPDWSIAPLYGNLPRQDQDAAIAVAPPGCHKIVLATSIAETSLTIDGIRVVVDSGLQRVARLDPVSGMTRLVTVAVSQASADQRRGRAGRLGPGICYRLWRPEAHATLPPFNRPEILDTDLTGLALELAAWGVRTPDTLSWLDPPPAAALGSARQLLEALGALAPDGTITRHGRLMADLPLHPRLAHMLLKACQEKMGGLACRMAALLSERDPLHFHHREYDADVKWRLLAMTTWKSGKPLELEGGRVDSAALRRILALSAMLKKRLGIGHQADAAVDPGRLLAWAYPDRIGQRRPGTSARFRLSNGRGAFLDPSDPLGTETYIVAPHLDGERREARIFMAAATNKACLLDQFAGTIQWQANITWDVRRRAVSAERGQMLGALTLSTEPLTDPDPDAVLAALLCGICALGIDALPWTRHLRAWQTRVLLLARIDAEGGPWPDLSDSSLAESLEAWLGPQLIGATRFADITTAILTQSLQQRLSWRQRQLLDELAPTHVTVPSGSRLPIDYRNDIPVLAVRIQEMFGATGTPTICRGRLPLMLHLLSPAGRPAQVTRDLAGFWQNSYAEVKRELKGRYPKHVWPENPLQASPTNRAKPRTNAPR